MKKKIIALMTLLMLICSTTALAKSDMKVMYQGNKIEFSQEPILLNNKTLVQLRPIAEKLGLAIDFSETESTITLTEDENIVVFKKDSDIALINFEEIKLDVPVTIIGGSTFVPVRDLAEPFGYSVGYDSRTKTVTINSSDYAEENTVAVGQSQVSTGSGKYPYTFFYQSQEDVGLENNGRGCCWVCSYAMLISNVKGEVVSPLDVATFNTNKGYSQAFMGGHETLVSSFGCKLVPALPQTSPYYKGFNTKNKGETTLNVTCNEDAKNAIKEALSLYPQGILVRYEGYPHTMMAVSFDGDTIYFNDPGLKNGEHITFENTCLKSYKLSDISFIQAIVK